MSEQKVFGYIQWRNLIIVITAVIAVGGYFVVYNHINVVQNFNDTLLTISAILLGFFITAYTSFLNFLGKISKNTREHSVLFQTNLFHSMVTNFKWLLRLLFINLFLGLILLLGDVKKFDYFIVDVFLLVDFAVLGFLLWQMISRFINISVALYRSESQNK